MIFSKTHLDGTTNEQTICRQLFAGHVVGSQPNGKEDKNASNDNSNNEEQLSTEIKE